jgi:hypothetical protein
METLSDVLVTKKGGISGTFFYCSDCDYKCCKKYAWDRHMSTTKHTKVTPGDALVTKKGKKGQKKYTCEFCNKFYESRNGLWKHNKICNFENNKEHKIIKTNETTDKDSLIMMLIKQNSELIKEQSSIRQMMIEQQNAVLEISKNGSINNCNNITNSHNKAFNLNFFLNETCKDAMNITDFVDSIKLQLSDLERVGELGYIEGISSIIVKNLKELDVTKRPVHCTDKKRETIYIKDENQWQKDDEKKKMHKLVRKVADKNARMIPKYKEVHPDYGKSTSKCSDQYNKIIVESMGGAGDNDFEKEEKIIKKVTKEVIVDKEP